MNDPYQILGVAPGCSESELKSAYKKAAMQHHPDRGGDEEQFKRVTEAYEIIKNGGPQQQNHNSYHFDDFAQQFGWHFNFDPRNPRHQPKNADVNVSYHITLEEVVTGVNKDIRINLPNQRHRDVSIQIPPGIKHGDRMRFQGCGENSIQGLQPGDLYVTVLEQRHPRFERHQNNCITVKPLTLRQALTGDTVVVEGLSDKKYSLKIPAGTQPDSKFRIPRAGFPVMNSSNIGDLIVAVKIKIPAITDLDTRIADL